MKTAGDATFIPEEEQEINNLLSVYTIEKAIYETDYEFNNRPDWLHIPLNGLKKILNDLVEQEIGIREMKKINYEYERK